MTLEEIVEGNTSMQYPDKFDNIGRVTREIIWQSLKQGRLLCGGYELANSMKNNPDNIMFCILPEVDASDVPGSIEHTLIQAICWENNIKILKVTDKEKLFFVLTGNHVAKNSHNLQSISCVLLEYPSKNFSMEEKDVLSFYKWNQKMGNSTSTIIQLPS